MFRRLIDRDGKAIEARLKRCKHALLLAIKHFEEGFFTYIAPSDHRIPETGVTRRISLIPANPT